MSIKLQLPRLTDLRPRLTVIGVGGAGCNAVNNMIAAGLTGVDFVVANTDAQALAASSAEHRLQLGASLTEGLGAGSKPEIGQAAAEEAIDEIKSQITGAHMVFIAGGMGGGTGTGAAAVIARVAREVGILTVGVVTKPFQFEGVRRMRIAEAGIAELKKYVDTLIVIPNQNLFRIANEKTTFAEAFVLADQVLYSGVACIVDLIIKEGLINLDFADVRTVLSGMGTAMMGTGEASGERRAIVAAEEAISNPLLDDVSLKGARGLLLSITGSHDLTLYEVDEAASRVRQEVDAEANIIVGATFDDSLNERVRVSIVASGMSRDGMALRPGGAEAEWARGGRKGPAPGAPFDPNAKRAAPASPAGGRQEDEIQRRLSEALQYGSVGSDYGGPGYAPPASGQGTPGRESWRAPGDVLIEETSPALAMAHPGPAPKGQDRPPGAAGPEAFSPAPPMEIRRSSRRIPEVDEFPPVGQREYRAKRAQDPAAVQAQDRGAGRRLGFFERLTGRGRRESDSPVNSPQHESPASPQASGWGPERSAPPTAEAADRSQRGTARGREEAELPMFFNRKTR